MANPIAGGDPVYTDKRFDSGGYEVCPEHGERLYGWKSSDPQHPHYIANGQGMPPTFVSPGRRSLKLREVEPDVRDNRDPEEVRREMIMMGVIEVAPTNGHIEHDIPYNEIP